jgi:hypothetical protein
MDLLSSARRRASTRADYLSCLQGKTQFYAVVPVHLIRSQERRDSPTYADSSTETLIALSPFRRMTVTATALAPLFG